MQVLSIIIIEILELILVWHAVEVSELAIKYHVVINFRQL